MKKNIKVKKTRNSITLLDDIVYSQTTDDQGNSIDLYMSILMHNVNVEKRVAINVQTNPVKRPVILCVPGGGFSHCERNRILPELQFLSEEGYIIAAIDYRLSSTAKFPAQMEDVCTAIKFLKSHADKYHIDPLRIGILGRSAGGCLSLMAGMNSNIGNTNNQYSQYSPDVNAACSLYGITDLPLWINYEIESELISDAEKPYQTKGGEYVGDIDDDIIAKAREASPIHYINSKMAPVLMLHGNCDIVVPMEQSERFYEEARKKGYEKKVDFYVVENANHGSEEFFQEEVKQVISDYFKENLLSRKI